ncbi:flagellar brake protein [Halobacillus sp. B23F22_1]|uniref:flagellar brake protein n=1 Tax=Halobacillus sp. B23F22_1 TaxID=3459514 RepID=UPI00373E7954
MLKVGTPITLELHAEKQEDIEKFKCRLVDHADQQIFIDYPVKLITQKTAFFFEGAQFQASFLGEDGSAYWFETEVLGRRKKNIPVLVLSFPGEDELVRVQRRQYVRIDTAINVAVKGRNSPVQFTTVTRDLSGGGMAIYEPNGTSLTNNQLFDFTLVLPMNSGEYYYIDVLGSVVRSSFNKESHVSAVSVEFVELNEKFRQLIIQYCFEQQMQMRKTKRL